MKNTQGAYQMKSIWWIVALAVFALIFLLFPFIEVEYVEKEPVTATEVYYETEPYQECHKVPYTVWEPIPPIPPINPSPYDYNTKWRTEWRTECVTEYTKVKKLREVVISEGVTKTKRISMFENWWIHIHPPPFSPILTTGFSNETTSPFDINTKEWVINWSYVPESEHPERAFFGFFVYPAGETTLYVESVVLPEETSGSIHSHAGSGRYYLSVEASNVEYWRILIKPA